MDIPPRLKSRRRHWRSVRGQRIAGILFEIDPQSAVIRICRKGEQELIDLRKFGLTPARENLTEDKAGL